ncbi:metal ABC transporter ATP-binding protein [Risungbinella massiliensis]|uniref:metal ABC transporter ATP-binding protein n=1 Tax=Risungbinella massiliensis TaxID=1329796 RepID=UPI0005CC393A|nr:metal ABC transporter ATP-binding protein [Risungbinella massiliensis]
MSNIIEVNNVSFSYDNQKVLDQVNLTLNKGEFLGILGPNGSGKSTLMKLILGLLKPDEGSIQIFETPVNQWKKRYRLGYVSQKSNSFDSGFPATVREVVTSGLVGKKGLFRRYNKQDRQRVEKALDIVGIADLANRNIGKLSGGQQQRAFIARALVTDPELLILDEPTVGIDAKSTASFYQLLADLHQQKDLSLILVTHDIGVVSSTVDRVACLNRKLHFHGSSQEFSENQKEILTKMYGTEIQLVHHHH